MHVTDPVPAVTDAIAPESLPAESRSVAEGGPAADALAESAPPRLLCVDDDVMVLSALQRQLRKQFEVVGALGGDKALQVLQERGPFAVVVSDLQMPGMNGLEFLARAREAAPDTVRMVLTGKADLDTAIRAVNEGIVFRFLTKPCEGDTLASSVKTAVEQYELARKRSAFLEGISSQVRATLTEMDSQAEESRRRELPGVEPHVRERMEEDSHFDPSSGLPNAAQAEAAISAILESGDSMAVAVFCVQRMGFTLSRYGKAVCAKVLLVSGQHLASALESHSATLFRWKGPAFVALIPNEKTALALKNDLQVSTSLVRDQYIEGPWRTIYLPIRMSVDVFPVKDVPLGTLLGQIHAFIERESDEVSLPV